MNDQSLHGITPATLEQSSRDVLIQHELDEVYLLIDHLSGRADRSVSAVHIDSCLHPGNNVCLIDEVCNIRWPPPKGDQARASQAAALFKARDKLNELAAPATGLTIAYTLLFAPAGPDNKSHTFFPQSLARHAYPHLVDSAMRMQRWLKWLLGLMIAGLVATSLLSWYVAYGSLVLQRIEQLDGQRAELSEALIKSPAASTTLTRGAPSEVWLRSERELVERLKIAKGGDQTLEPAYDAALRLESKRAAADAALNEWTSYFLWLPRFADWMLGVTSMAEDSPPGATPEQQEQQREQRTEQKEQWSANLLAVLGNYVLPMMYGFLGAAAAVMVNLNQKIRSSRLSPRDRRMSQVQLVLGIIMGACIGLFLSPSQIGTGAALSGRSVALSASALSFLAGFGVEGVFKMLESILITVFGDQPRTPAPSR
jgi:hypothetical protein